jgi:hypothetical protein
MQDIPHTPESAPTRIDDLTIGYQIGAEYLELTGEQTGGAPILSFNL